MIDWQTIDTVLLDMDGTLLDLNYDTHFWLEFLPTHYANTKACDPAIAKQEILQLINHLQGSLNWYCLDYWSEQLELDIPALKAEVAHLIKERPYCIEFLCWLKSHSKTNILVTNSHQAGVDLKFANTDIAPHFDYIYTSHQFKHPKESSQFWEAFHAHHPFDLDRALLIDDNETVLATAQTFGVGHLLTIEQPNLAQPPRKQLRFPAITCYQQLMA